MKRARVRIDSWREAISLTFRYIKQETVAPLKGLGRFFAFGIAAAICFSVAAFFAVLSLLRALQTETGDHFTGSLSWVPYLLTLVLAIIIASLGALAVGATKRRYQKDRKPA